LYIFLLVSLKFFIIAEVDKYKTTISVVYSSVRLSVHPYILFKLKCPSTRMWLKNLWNFRNR